MRKKECKDKKIKLVVWSMIFISAILTYLITFVISSISVSYILSLSNYPKIRGIKGATSGNTYYVSTNAPCASDQNTGLASDCSSYTSSNKVGPYKTIQKAADVANAGDTVKIANGTYYEYITINKSGTASAPITFTNYTGESPTIDYSYTSTSGWNVYSGNIYVGTVNITVQNVIADDIVLTKAASLDTISAGKYYQSGTSLYIQLSTGDSPANHAIGILKSWSSADWNSHPVIQVNGSYINISNLNVRFGRNENILVVGNYVTINNCTIKFAVGAAVTFWDSDYSKLTNSKIYWNVMQNYPRNIIFTNGGWAGAVAYRGGNYGEINGNTVYKNHGEGITAGGNAEVGSATNIKIQGNIVYDNYSTNIYCNGCRSTSVIGNYSYVTGEMGNAGGDFSKPFGILMGDEYTAELRNIIVANNITRNCMAGFRYWKDVGAGFYDSAIVNNTFINSSWTAISADSGTLSGNVIKNNIIYQSSTDMIDLDSPGNTILDYNLWFNTNVSMTFYWGNNTYTSFNSYKSSTGQDAHSISGISPSFVSQSGTTAESFKLTSNSPAIDKGVSVSSYGINTDYWGTTRPMDGENNGTSIYDIGAHEYVYVGVCTDANWTYSDGTCQTNSTLTRTWTKIGSCTGGVTHPPSETISCIPACTSANWTYTDGICQSNNTLIRTWTQIGTCSGGITHSPTETVTCVYIPTCTDSNWSYIDGECQTTSKLTRTWTKIGTCSGGISHPTTETVSCTYNPNIPKCTENNWNATDGDCQSTGILNRTWNKSGNCEGGIIHPSIEIINCIPTCTTSNWSYSDGVCQSNNKLTRTWKKVGNCSGGTFHLDTEQISCTFGQSPTCTEDNWSYIDDPCKSTQKLTRTWRKISDCNGGVSHPETESISCAYAKNAPLCKETDWGYSDSDCKDGTFTRKWSLTNTTCSGGISHPSQENFICETPKEVEKPSPTIMVTNSTGKTSDFNANEDIVITIDTSSLSDSVSKVVIYDNEVKICEDTEAPFTCTINKITEGSHTISADIITSNSEKITTAPYYILASRPIINKLLSNKNFLYGLAITIFFIAIIYIGIVPLLKKQLIKIYYNYMLRNQPKTIELS